ncbi:PilZ domain-containing protein [bacterium]|nr:PilZ domain-containing protein [bacterium]
MNNRRKSPRLEKRLPLQVEGQPSWLVDLSASGARIQVTDQATYYYTLFQVNYGG